MTNQGWECPICFHVYSPIQLECTLCTKRLQLSRAEDDHREKVLAMGGGGTGMPGCGPRQDA